MQIVKGQEMVVQVGLTVVVDGIPPVPDVHSWSIKQRSLVRYSTDIGPTMIKMTLKELGLDKRALSKAAFTLDVYSHENLNGDFRTFPKEERFSAMWFVFYIVFMTAFMNNLCFFTAHIFKRCQPNVS